MGKCWESGRGRLRETEKERERGRVREREKKREGETASFTLEANLLRPLHMLSENAAQALQLHLHGAITRTHAWSYNTHTYMEL